MPTDRLRPQITPDLSSPRLALGAVLGTGFMAMTGGLWAQSLLVGLVVLALPFVALSRDEARKEVVGGLAVAWALVGWQIGAWLAGGEAGLLLAGLCGALGFAANRALGQSLDGFRAKGPILPQARQALAQADWAGLANRLRPTAETMRNGAAVEGSEVRRYLAKLGATACLFCGLLLMAVVAHRLSEHATPTQQVAQAGTHVSAPARQAAPRATPSPLVSRPASRLSPDLDKYEIVACVQAAMRDADVARSYSREELAVGCAVLLSQ